MNKQQTSGLEIVADKLTENNVAQPQMILSKRFPTQAEVILDNCCLSIWGNLALTDARWT